MIFIKKTILIISLAIMASTIIPSPALALYQCGRDVDACTILEFNFSTGIIPVDATSGNTCFDGAGGINMIVGWCDILQIISNIIGIVYALVIPLITIIIIIGGLYLVTAGGNEGQIKKGKGFLKSAIIGLIIVLSAGIIVGLIIRGLGVTEGATLMPWLF